MSSPSSGVRRGRPVALSRVSALGSPRPFALIAGFLATFAVSGLAIRYGWALPGFRESATRERNSNESYRAVTSRRSRRDNAVSHGDADLVGLDAPLVFQLRITSV